MTLTMTQITEIAVYELFSLLPAIILALIPFRDFLRVSRKTIGILLSSLYALMVFLQVLAWNHLALATVFSVGIIALYLGLYKIIVRTPIARQLFVLLIILNYESFVIVFYSYFAYHYFELEDAPFSLGSIGVLIIIYLISYPIMFMIMDKKIRPLTVLPENNRIWHFLWLVPAVSCFSYYFNLFSNGGVMAFSKSLNNVFFAALLNIGNLLITFIIAHLVGESYKSIQLKAENYQLNMQFVQYESLKNRLDEARRARHDFRHNILIIQSYLEDHNYEGLQTYIAQYIANLPTDKAIAYCENYAVNALLIYYADLAHKQNITFQVEADYDDHAAIATPDVVTLLGNLLENAVEACARQTTGEAFIHFTLKQMENKIVITLDNSYNGIIQKSDNHFISSKNDRIGVGIASVEKIAAKYHGITKFEYDESTFYSSVLLYI